MPMYEYQCDKCAHRFETLVRNPSEEPEECPECGHKEVVRCLSVVALSGSGSDSGCAPSGSRFS